MILFRNLTVFKMLEFYTDDVISLKIRTYVIDKSTNCVNVNSNGSTAMNGLNIIL